MQPDFSDLLLEKKASFPGADFFRFSDSGENIFLRFLWRGTTRYGIIGAGIEKRVQNGPGKNPVFPAGEEGG